MKLELKAIRLQRQAWIDAVNSGDIDKFRDILSNDAVWIPPRMPALNGRDAIIEWMTPFFADFKHEFSVEPQSVKGAGNWAVEQSDFISKLEPNDGGGDSQLDGKYLIIWRWEKDNIWRMERYVDMTEEDSE